MHTCGFCDFVVYVSMHLQVSVDLLCCTIATEEDLCSVVKTFGERKNKSVVNFAASVKHSKGSTSGLVRSLHTCLDCCVLLTGKLHSQHSNSLHSNEIVMQHFILDSYC